MRPNDEFIPVESNAPLMGLATTPPSTRLDPSYSPRLLNCYVRDGVVRRRAGYQQLAQRLVGRVLAITEFGPIGSDPWFVVLTSHRQYAYDPAVEKFVDLTPDQEVFAIDATDTNKFVITGDEVAKFTAGRKFSVDGDNAGVYTVVSSAVNGGQTEITVEETVPSVGVIAGNITIAADFTTGDRDHIEFAGVTDVNGRRLIITNGVDAPRVWDGDINTPFTDWVPTYTGLTTFKTLAVFNEHLFLGGVTTADEEPQLIAWSTAGDFDDFETGTSGAQLLYQLTGGIKALKVLGDRLAIYSDDAIMTGVFVGEPAYFAFEVVIPEGTRLISPKAILSINVGHIFVSEENVYLFDGTRGLRILGEGIYSDLKSFKDYENLYRCATINDFSKRTLFISIPDVRGGSMVYTAVYDVFDLSRIVWAQEQYRDDARAFGFFTNRDVTLTWDDAPWEPDNMPWGDELGAWAEEAEQLRFPIRAFGTDDGYVFIVTEGVLPDVDTVPEQLYDTIDFTVPETFHSSIGRWVEIEFEGFGTEVDVQISLDQGRNFIDIETVVLAEDPRHYVVHMDQISRTLRVRFRSMSDFGLRWIRLWVRPAGPR